MDLKSKQDDKTPFSKVKMMLAASESEGSSSVDAKSSMKKESKMDLVFINVAAMQNENPPISQRKSVILVPSI